jgi:hypothetical protein
MSSLVDAARNCDGRPSAASSSVAAIPFSRSYNSTRHGCNGRLQQRPHTYVDADYNACLHVIATAEPRGNPAPRAVGWEWRSARSLWRPPSPPTQEVRFRMPARIHRLDQMATCGSHRHCGGTDRGIAIRRPAGRPSSSLQLNSTASAVESLPLRSLMSAPDRILRW